MAEEALNMSLDDLIKKSRTKDERKPQRGGAERHPERSGPGPRTTRGRGEFRAQPTVRTVAVANKKIQKPTGGAARGAVAGTVDREKERALKLAALEGNARWKHDKFEDEPSFQTKKSVGPPAAPGTKLKISNLDYNVTNSDIEELFSTCGPLKYHGLVFDRSGRSEGVAYVVFEKVADAKRAITEYNNVALDGQQMNIETVESQVEQGGMRLSSGISVSRGGTRGARNDPKYGRAFQQALGGENKGRIGQRGGQRAGNRNRLGSRVVREAADLDKELVEYMED